MSTRRPEQDEHATPPEGGAGRVLEFRRGATGDATDEVTRLLREERERIARDLHDVVLQDLFASAMALQATARAAEDPELRQGLELAVRELHATSRNIRSSVFGLPLRTHDGDLRNDVERLTRRAEAVLKLAVDVDVRGPLESLRADVGADLAAVLAEALSNAARHAEADEVAIRIEVGEQQARLTVLDDGVGLTEDVAPHGLANLRERAERHDGTLEVGPRPEGGGTRLVWTVRLAS